MKFSCAIPVYNTRPDYLLEAVYSILNQTLPPDEIILVDDGSTCEKTRATLRFIEQELNIKVHWLPENGGTSVALNHAHRVASHDYLAIMGSDDISHPERFKRQMDFIAKNEGIEILGCSCFGFNTSDIYRDVQFLLTHHRWVNRETISERRWKTCFVTNHGTVIYSRKVYANYFYDPAYRRTQDVGLWRVLLSAGFTFHNIPDVLYAYRQHQ